MTEAPSAWPPAPARVRRSAAGRFAAGPGAAALALGAATAFVAVVDPNRPGHYPTCPFLWATGRYCPGCGGLRCVHALAHGDVLSALSYNALAVCLLPPAAWLWGRWAVRAVRGTPRNALAAPWLPRALLAVVLVFWLVRNLPFGAFLAP